MLHAVFYTLWLAFIIYTTIDLARRPRRRTWVLGMWAALALISLISGDGWATGYAVVNLLAAHFSPLIDLALIRWADRLWEDLRRR